MSDHLLDKRNDFIFFNQETGEAELTPQSKSLSVVKAIDRKDRSAGKIFLKKCVNMVYYLYHKDSPISHLSLEMKKNEMVNLRNDFVKFDFDHQEYNDFAKFFIKTHHSRIEHRYLSFIDDMDGMRDSLVDMPTRVRTKVYKNVKDKDDDTIEHTLEGYVEYDNDLDKTKAISALIKLDQLEKLLRAAIESEYKAKKSSTRRNFDK